MWDLPVVWPIYVFGFLFGAAITSFACLVVDRLPHQLGWREDAKSGLTIVSPPSHCECCNQRITWLYLIPVLGYVFARGKCQSCSISIPIIYPLLELLGGIGVIFILFFYGIDYSALLIIGLFLALLFLAWMDIQERWLPEVVTLPLFWIGLLYSPFTHDISERAYGSCAGFVLMWSSMFFVSRSRQESVFAGGDIVLATVAGAWLGVYRLPYYLIASSVFFILYALPARLKGHVFVPMGPALVLGFSSLFFTIF